MSNNISSPDRMAEHAWSYFTLHATHRISLFNFFLVLSSLVLAGLATTIQSTGHMPILGILLGFLLVMVAFVFWKLDQRVSFLIKRSELAIAELEQSMPNERIRLFLDEPKETGIAISAGNFWQRHWTYGKSFRFVFLMMALIGLSASALSFLRYVALAP
jgi:hypothetical protein